MKSEKYRANIIKYSCKIADYKKNNTGATEELKALELCLESSLMLYDTANLLKETKPLMDEIKCQNLMPIQKSRGNTTNLKTA